MNRLLVLFIPVFSLFFQLAPAAENRYVVFFTDKEDPSFSISEPEKFLSPRAIQRRVNQDIQITDSDLPVKFQYISSLKNLGAEIFFKSRWMNAVLIQADENLVPVLSQQQFIKKVEFVAPGVKLNNARALKFRKNTSHQIQQEVTEMQNKMIGVDVMHTSGYLGQTKLIGVFDGGFENVDQISYFGHLFNSNKIVSTWDFVTNSPEVYKYDDHGTNVLSCLAGYESGRFVGTAYQGDFVLCVTEDVSTEYRIEEYNWLFAAEYADSIGVDIINSSLGYNTFDDPTMDYSYEDLDGKTAVISRAAGLAASKGILVVASAGNEGNKFWKYIVPPADADSIISVGAVDSNLARAYFSSLGPTADNRIKPEVSALGLGTKSISSSGNIILTNGTSLSTPLITGLVAGIWELNSGMSNLEVIDLLKNSATNAESPNNEVGYGVPDFKKVKSVVKLDNEQIIKSGLYLSPNPVNDHKILIQGPDEFFRKPMEVKVYNLSGQLIESHKVSKLYDNFFQLETEKWLPGMYILAIENQDSFERLKFLKF
jgi:hypothetical protein